MEQKIQRTYAEYVGTGEASPGELYTTELLSC